MVGVWMRTLGSACLLVCLALIILMAQTKVEPIGIFFVIVLFCLGVACHISAPRGGSK